MTIRSKIYMIAFALLLVFVGFMALSFGNRQSSAQPALISADVAAARALVAAQDDGHFGGVVGEPSEMRGRTMTYDEAIRFVFGQPAAPANRNEGTIEIQGNSVWLIVLRGAFVEHVPAAPGIAAKDVIHKQMSIIIDGRTGEVIERTLISPQKELSVATLAILKKPAGPAIPAPQRDPIVTEVPAPAPPNQP